jgi:hypothetical protein
MNIFWQEKWHGRHGKQGPQQLDVVVAGIVRGHAWHGQGELEDLRQHLNNTMDFVGKLVTKLAEKNVLNDQDLADLLDVESVTRAT